MTIRTPVLGALFSVAALIAPVSAQAVTELTFSSLFPPNHFSWPVFRAWSDDIAAATNGEVRIVFTPQSVSPPPGVVDAVRNGVADAGFIFNGFLGQNYPGVMLTQMPFIDLGDTAATSRVFWENYQEHFAPVERIRGVEVVSAFHLGPNILCSTTDTPLSTLEELHGRRVWVLPGTISETMANMGLAITASPAVQVQELVSRNTVDAIFGLTQETVVSFGAAPYVKSCVDMSPALQSASFLVFFNQRAWDRLSDEQRATVMEYSGSAFAERMGAAAAEADTVTRAQLEASGVTYAPVDPGILEAMHSASDAVLTQWAAAVQSAYGIDGRALVEEVRAEIEAASAE